jgi:hypothetical protein
MAKKPNVEELFEIIGKDPLSWLAQAKEMKLVADIILPTLQRELAIPPTFPETQRKRLAYVGSYMLFIGLAFENLIKGILIGRDSTLVTKEAIKKRGILNNNGHGIKEGANRVICLTEQELQLLARIEEYLIWAGRYPLPLNSDRFFKSENQELRSFRSNDPFLIDKIFDELSIVLENERIEAKKS